MGAKGNIVFKYETLYLDQEFLCYSHFLKLPFRLIFKVFRDMKTRARSSSLSVCEAQAPMGRLARRVLGTSVGCPSSPPFPPPLPAMLPGLDWWPLTHWRLLVTTRYQSWNFSWQFRSCLLSSRLPKLRPLRSGEERRAYKDLGVPGAQSEIGLATLPPPQAGLAHQDPSHQARNFLS